MELHRELGLEIKGLMERIEHALNPDPGQRLAPAKVQEECQTLAWKIITAMQYASAVMFDQAYRIRKLNEGLSAAQPEKRKPAGSVKKSSKSKTRAS